MKQKIIFVFCLLVNLITLAQHNNEGFAIQSRMYLDFKTKKWIEGQPFGGYFKVWYKQDKAIREKLMAIWEGENDTVGSYKEKVIKYVFIDIPKHIYYEYDAFSPTSKLKKVYKVNDSMVMANMGYIFWGHEDSSRNIVIPTNFLSVLSDTLINGTLHKRERYQKTVEFNGDKNYTLDYIVYTRNDIKKSILHLDKKFDEKNKLPVVRIEIYEKNGCAHLYEINYVRQRLTKKEKKIFKVWGKNMLIQKL